MTKSRLGLWPAAGVKFSTFSRMLALAWDSARDPRVQATGTTIAVKPMVDEYKPVRQKVMMRTSRLKSHRQWSEGGD